MSYTREEELTDGMRHLLAFVRDNPHCTRRAINDALAGPDGIYSWDGWKWGMQVLINRNLVRQFAKGHYYALS